MPVLFVLFGLTTGALAFRFWNLEQRRMRERAGRPLPLEPTVPVKVDWLGDGVVLKVYYEHRAYAAHVYWREQFVGEAGGFGNVDAALGWGRSHARSLGANI